MGKGMSGYMHAHFFKAQSVPSCGTSAASGPRRRNPPPARTVRDKTAGIREKQRRRTGLSASGSPWPTVLFSSAGDCRRSSASQMPRRENSDR